jgi:hypothetical protein
MSAVLTRARNRQIELRRSTSKSLSDPALMAIYGTTATDCRETILPG